MTTQTETAAPTQVQLVPDMLAVWSGREEFLQWCRERGVKGDCAGRSRIANCLIAKALNSLTGKEFFVVPVAVGCPEWRAASSGVVFLLPAWLGQVADEFDHHRLGEEFGR